MIRRRHLLAATAGALAAPAIVEKVGAQSAFDWKQFKGTRLEVNFGKSPRPDVLQANQKEFEELTGIRVGFEQVPEQQQRPKIALELASGRPSFDVVNVSMHVQKKLVEKGNWLEDLRPLVADPKMTSPDFDLGDFSAPGMAANTAADGRLMAIPVNQDLFILFYNKALFAEKGIKPPATMDEMMAAALALTDKSKGIAGFVGRGLKNANLPLYTTILLGHDQETISADGTTLLMDTPAAIEAATFYSKLLREAGPQGVVGFKAPLIDKTKSRVADTVGFMPIPRGPKAQHSATFIEGVGVARGAKNRGGAWLYVQWATSKAMCAEYLRTGSGTPPRASAYSDPKVLNGSVFPKEWFGTVQASLKIARSGLPVIVGVTEFRDVFGVALTNTITGADPKAELVKATEIFKPVLAKELAG